MTAPRFDHLEWSKSQADHYRHNLANSAVPEPDLAALGLPHQAGLPREGYALLPELERALGERLPPPRRPPPPPRRRASWPPPPPAAPTPGAGGAGSRSPSARSSSGSRA